MKNTGIALIVFAASLITGLAVALFSAYRILDWSAAIFEDDRQFVSQVLDPGSRFASETTFPRASLELLLLGQQAESTQVLCVALVQSLDALRLESISDPDGRERAAARADEVRELIKRAEAADVCNEPYQLRFDRSRWDDPRDDAPPAAQQRFPAEDTARFR
ncbi:MAG: hypothetical protein ACXIUZ_05645 [Lysobacteraceae bacterium]